jgi:Flp pilus assembly protein TadG
MTHRPNKTRRKAAAVAEFAVLLPLLIMLFLFAFDFARVFYYSTIIENCAQNAALFGSQAFDNQNQQWVGSGQ